jgi:hypothetical protein
LNKKRQFFCQNFRRKYLKKHIIGPWLVFAAFFSFLILLDFFHCIKYEAKSRFGSGPESQIQIVSAGIARCKFILRPEISIWVYFGGPWNGKF